MALAVASVVKQQLPVGLKHSWVTDAVVVHEVDPLHEIGGTE